MMPALSTPVAAEALPFSLDWQSQVLSLGSCFADEMGRRLSDSGFVVEQNPFGTLYNPASGASALRRIMDDHEVQAIDLVQHEGLWHSWHHHGAFSHPTADETLAACNQRLHQAHRALREATLLVVTFGTAYVYEYHGQVVANCHKLPADQFTRRRLTTDEIVSLWSPLLDELLVRHPSLSILFTVSPIRHLADGAHGNQLSKSILLLAVDQLVARQAQRVAYFPAYEIVLDELRDYRFFGPDMAHPTALAADIVWHRFQQATMSPAVQQQAHNNAKCTLRCKHVPIH